MNDSLKLERIVESAERLGIKYKVDEPLFRHTTFKVGGAADIMLFPDSAELLLGLVLELKRLDYRFFILGNGSNTLFSDNGYRGAVICTCSMSKISVSGCKVIADAGTMLCSVCRTAMENGLGGMEFAYGIPGTVGGAVYMNAGAYGGDMSCIVESVRCITSGGDVREYTADELLMGYRSSRFTDSGEIIVSVSFSLKCCDPNIIRSKMDELMERRRSRQPLEYPSAGSVFKRPEGTFAGMLIEQSGLKGYSVGGAMVSLKHANFVINNGNATANDICRVISDVQKIVEEKTGYRLECEIKLIDE